MISGKELFKCLGGFWFDIKEIETLCNAIAVVWKQIDQELKELENSTSRHKIDVFRKVEWLPLYLDEVNEPLLYDAGGKYDVGYTFDTTLRTINVQLPDYVVSVEEITDKINNPTLVIKPENERKFLVDSSLKKVWLHNCLIDRDDLYTQFGYTLGIQLPSSQEYKDLINAIMDSYVNGPSESCLLRALTALIGNDKFTIGWDVSGIVLTKNYTGLCYDVPFYNTDCKVNVSTQEGMTRVDIETLPKDFLDLVHQRGIQNFEPVTDKCELYKIQKELSLKTASEASETETTNTGLTQYAMFHRFN